MKPSKIITSAPGKLHLAGEHAVVYGKPALLAATAQRTYVTIESENSKQKTVNSNDKYTARIIKLVEERYRTQLNNVSLTISSQIPVGAGMGSSAAVAVATIGALTQWLQRPWNISEINELAYEAEKFQHGQPSGGDNSIISFGGLLWYRKEFEFLKTFWLLPFKIPAAFPKLELIQTERVETTGEMVQWVAIQSKQKRDKICATIETATKNLVQAIHDENTAGFVSALQTNQRQLEKLGVVSEATLKLITAIEAAGGVAKISGAGGRQKGSGIVLAFHEQPSELKKIAKKFGYKSFSTSLGAPGVRIEMVSS